MFNVYPPNYFDIYKKNENFNSVEILKDLRFQETMLDKNILFDEFFGDIFGKNLTHEEIGVKIYERIANFVQNTQDVDHCNIDSLNSIAEFLNHNQNGEKRYIIPERVKRLVDLLSIDKHRLLGELNKFRENFDVRGRTIKTEYGRNIGNIIDPKTYIVNEDIPIVALEKFSNEYVLLNPFQPVEATGSSNYPLSSYNSDWGWPLVLPTVLDFNDIEKYYLFFEYNDQYDGTKISGDIDFENPNTTVDYDDIFNQPDMDGGIYEHLFTDTLYQSLKLVN
jgi:hypothetical protein